jgi:glyoxylase-like metal-dependent hydrolase (beta-lactamase superfamily II)
MARWWLAACLLPTFCAWSAEGVNVLEDPFVVDFEQLHEDVWVVRRPRPERQPVMGNGLVIINQDHVVVVDGNGSPLLAQRVIEGIRARTALPVRYLILSHWHGDHNLGSFRFQEAWPGLRIIGHEFTHAAMLGAPMDYVEEIRKTTAPAIERMRQVALSGVMPDGSAVPEHLLVDLRDLVDNGDLMISELDASRITPPDYTFTNELILEEGGRRIEIRHLGKSNTAGDAVVWLPVERILATGDIVVAPTPYGFGSYPRSWVRVLGRIKAMQPRFIVPGHGRVMTNTAYIDLLAETLDFVAAYAEAAVEADRSLQDFMANFSFDGSEQRFTAGDPTLESRFQQWFAAPVVGSAWNEAAGVDNEPLFVPETESEETE